jgi:hypothetical protein
MHDTREAHSLRSTFGNSMARLVLVGMPLGAVGGRTFTTGEVGAGSALIIDIGDAKKRAPRRPSAHPHQEGFVLAGPWAERS